MPEQIPPDIDWLKKHYGDLVFEVANARGIAAAAQLALVTAEKKIADLEAEITALKGSQ